MAIWRKKDKNGKEVGDYYIDYYVNGKRKREKIGPSRKLANQVLAKRKIQIDENKFLDIAKIKRIKLKEFAELFKIIQNRSKETRKTIKAILAK